MSKQVDFYFDYGSPASYLAHTQLPSIVKRTGATVNYKPILLGGIFMATGNKSPVEIPQKKNWMTQDLQNFARQYGVPLRWNQYFPINTLALMRGAIFAQRENFLLPYSDAIFKAIWVDDLNMGDPQQIGSVLKSAGLDAGNIFAAVGDPVIKDALKDATNIAVERGAFGAPTFFVGEQMFFGQDRLNFVEKALNS